MFCRAGLTYRTTGDVSLSAEDLTLTPMHAPPLLPLPVDHKPLEEGVHDEDEEDVDYDDFQDEEEHHIWLGGSTAVKFLLAGGIAGAGQYAVASACDVDTDYHLLSVPNFYSSFRSVEDLPDNAPTRPWGDFVESQSTSSRLQSDRRCGSPDLFGRWRARVLDR